MRCLDNCCCLVLSCKKSHHVTMVSLPCRDVWGITLVIVLFIAHSTSSDGGACPHGCTCSATIIDCRHSNLTSLPSTLPLAETIEKLLVSGNRIKQIGLELKSYPALERVDVASNNISSISDGAFSGIENLDNLILRRNYLAKLTNETFRGLRALKTLDLGYNVLKTLPNGAFRDLKSLQQLDLMKNNISFIEDDAFVGLESLQVLNLTRNLLQVYPTNALSRLTSVTRLVLDDNRLKTIPRFAFAGLLNLKFLSLNGNHLASLEPSAFAVLKAGSGTSLVELSIKGTDLNDVPTDAFKSLTSLEILDISKNKFKIFKRGSFNGLKSLRKLTVTSSRYLTTIENGTFEFMSNLTEVIIRNNKALTSIGETTFPSAGSLVDLDLSSNSIRTFYPNMVPWDRNATVDIRNNQLLCDCNIVWMFTTLKNANNPNTKLYASNLSCAAPDPYRGRNVFSLSNSTFSCDIAKPYTHDVLSRVKVAAIAAVITSLLLMCCALFIKFRKKICMVIRRQYRYRQYKNNGSLSDSRQNGELPEEGTAMEVISSYKDDPEIQVQGQ
ncbi:leucine-rich repeat and immunoglobulin-like domain-containing nogo receptor-interacting protein 4 isoform X1 [Haliotis rufescens]|uniref:leucine-rich repeat and immunoglobulin-like domain-containing nogo receptor-interacting protein 4 isoform X1 n=2 Tax=Haliotis rufescens TaxID=6454 RepID=UPI00201EABA5|nr:leucine-rich repeat and immunoglobulin-like domain-containing nogo receptor-interacting protein 4 isoform X1 [Haliotis rufescens]